MLAQRAVAHSAFAHRAFLAVDVSRGKTTADRVQQECRRLGIGYIEFTDAKDYDTFEIVISPLHREPDAYDVDSFIATQISSHNQDSLRELLS